MNWLTKPKKTTDFGCAVEGKTTNVGLRDVESGVWGQVGGDADAPPA